MALFSVSCTPSTKRAQRVLYIYIHIYKNLIAPFVDCVQLPQGYTEPLRGDSLVLRQLHPIHKKGSQNLYICSLRSWNNTSYSICWDKFLAFFHQQKFTKLYWTINCNVWSVKYPRILNKKNKRTKVLNKIDSRS